MSCEICGRHSCCKSYHSLEEQSNFDNIADNVKSRAIRVISNKISRIDGHYHGNNYYIKLEDVIKIIENYD